MIRESYKLLAFASIALLYASSCKKHPKLPDNKKVLNSGTTTAALANSNCNSPYAIILESVSYVNDHYEWVWSIQNPNPGNGNTETTQDLSHWDISLGNCLKFNDVVGAATSTDGENWVSFQPTYGVDKSIRPFNTGNVIKFDVGTRGSSVTYYKLIITRDLSIDMESTSYYKSGQKTGAGTQCFPGLGCDEITDDYIAPQDTE